MTQVLPVFKDVYSAGQPSEADLATLAVKGVRTLINLRQPSEPTDFDEAAFAAAHELRYISLPISGSKDLTPRNIRHFAHELATAREIGPVLVHCGSANRAGAMLALEQFWVQHSSPVESLAVGRAAGLTDLESAVVERLEGQTAGS